MSSSPLVQLIMSGEVKAVDRRLLEGAAPVDREDLAADLYTWGSGYRSKLGHGEEDDELRPRVLEALLGHELKLVALGASHSVALMTNGQVYTWGAGAGGRLGHDGERDRFTPLRVVALDVADIVAVACGDCHSVAVTDEGAVYTWGRGENGQLGYPATKQLVPQVVPGLSERRVTSAACGDTFTLLLTETGEVLVCGSGDQGQLGLGTATTAIVGPPVKVRCLDSESVLCIGASSCHCAAVTGNGALFTWGSGRYGQLGHGHEDNVYEPTKVALPKGVEIVDVACGGGHTVVLSSTGSVFVTGDGSSGQLGLGPGVVKSMILRELFLPSGAGRAKSIAAGDKFSAVSTDGNSLFTFGCSANGRLGHGITGADKWTPTMVEALHERNAQILGVYCGAAHAAVLLSKGWVPDVEAKSCMGCRARFTTMRRRHHCRHCGGIFCASCSSRKIRLLTAGVAEPERVCEKCFSLLSKS
jgi:alpha-tubulin suppressor-like RCC1 family protein